MEDKKDEEVRLQVFLARSGTGSRRGCEEIIRQGRVRINGRIVKQMGQKVSTEDIVEVDNKRVYPDRRFIYLALNKPKFVVSAMNDPEGRKTIEFFIKGKFPFRLFHVGRLDYLSTGLMFLTNDGNFSRHITDPSRGVEKEYKVDVSRTLSTDLLDSFVRGVVIDGEKLSIDSYRVTGEKSVHIILKEGKNREIRRLFNHSKIRIKKLHRIRIGGIQLKGMIPGEYRVLNSRDLAQLGYKTEGRVWS